jgi:hypothetical protein
MIVQLQGVTYEDRHAMTSAASDAVSVAGGYILDFRQFSNLAVVFTIELPPSGYARLRDMLTNCGIRMSLPSRQEIDLARSSSTGAVAGSLRLDFHHDEPDLRIPIPAVPG